MFPEVKGRVEYCIPRVLIDLIYYIVACSNCFIIIISAVIDTL